VRPLSDSMIEERESQNVAREPAVWATPGPGRLRNIMWRVRSLSWSRSASAEPSRYGRVCEDSRLGGWPRRSAIMGAWVPSGGTARCRQPVIAYEAALHPLSRPLRTANLTNPPASESPNCPGWVYEERAHRPTSRRSRTKREPQVMWEGSSLKKLRVAKKRKPIAECPPQVGKPVGSRRSHMTPGSGSGSSASRRVERSRTKAAYPSTGHRSRRHHRCPLM
jgi:hypothetical protein